MSGGTVTLASFEHSGSRFRASLEPARVLAVALFFMLGANVVRVPLLNAGRSQAPVGINDVAVIFVLMVGALVMLRRRAAQLDRVALAAMLFIAIGGLSAISGIVRFGLTPHELAVSLAYLVRWAVYFCLYVVVINCVRASDVERIWTAMEWTILVFAAFGIVQSVFFPNFFEMFREEGQAYVDYDPQGNRLVSTVLEPNVAAAMIVLVLVVQVARISAGVPVAFWKPVLLMVALVLTVSRSGLLGLFAGGLVILAARGLSKRLLRFVAPVIVLVLVALPRLVELATAYGKTGMSDASALARLVAWGRAFQTFLDYPWIGIGVNTYAFVQERRGFEVMNNASYSVEGGLLFIMVMTGIIGLLAYLAMLWSVFRRCRRIWREPATAPHERGLAIGAVAATIAILVHSMFVNSLLVPFVMEMLWILWGFAFLMQRGEATSEPAYRLASIQ